jgi:excisionase family DNA binding protein
MQATVRSEHSSDQMVAQQLLRVHRAAKILDVSISQVYNLINRGDLQAIRVGRSIRVPMRLLEAYIAQQTKEGLN